MPLWKRLWLLFAVIGPLLVMLGVPALAYAIAWVVVRMRQRSDRDA